MGRRTPEEIWKALVAEAGEDEADRDEAGEALIAHFENMSVEQAEKELAEAGFDVKATDAEAEEFLGALGRGELPAAKAEQTAPKAAEPSSEPKAPERAPETSNVVPISRARRLRGRVVAAAAAAAVAASGAAYLVANQLPNVAQPAPSDAAELRGRARAALDAGRPQECLDLLDEAKAKDPEGDSAPDVVRLRKEAGARLKP
jgi:hypothetical protein